MKNISLSKFTDLVVQKSETITNRFINFYHTFDTTYQEVDASELIDEVKDKIQDDNKNVADLHREAVWQAGWKENLDAFKESQSVEAITPKFLRPNNPIRFDGRYILPTHPYFEREYSKLIQLFIYDNFVLGEGVKNVYEFGCGSGFNLLFLWESYKDLIPGLSLTGLDFVESSVLLMDELGTHYDASIRGRQFDMKNPDGEYHIAPNSCVFTACAIEQLNSKFYKFIDYLVEESPQICFHLEPIIENYDKNTLFDKLAIDFHTKRGYSKGLKPYLLKLQDEEKIEVVFDKRLRVGSLFHEGYQLMVWKPSGGKNEK